MRRRRSVDSTSRGGKDGGASLVGLPRRALPLLCCCYLVATTLSSQTNNVGNVVVLHRMMLFVNGLSFVPPMQNSRYHHKQRQNQHHHRSPAPSEARQTTTGTIMRKTRTTTTLTTMRAASSSSSSLSHIGTNAAAAPIPKDIVIIGAGLAGLSAALHIATTTTSSRHVTVLDRETPEEQMSSTNVGSFAAAGMLAPQSERLPSGPLLDMCLQSRDMYGDFVNMVETLARGSGSEGYRYLWKDETTTKKGGGEEDEEKRRKMEPWEVGYQCTGGFLAPAFAGDAVATWSPPSASSSGDGSDGSSTAQWLDEIQVRELEPCLHPDVIGGWWFPEDASVDSRRLTCSLRAACISRGVELKCGKEFGVESLELSGGKCQSIRLTSTQTYKPKSILISNGSWMRSLLPVPITPHKGQSFSVRQPTPGRPKLLSRVLFAQDTYIVPKADGRIVVGATVEPGLYDNTVTPSGLMHCMANAIRLVPALKDMEMEESWCGLRPTTPDKGPILGQTSWNNLYIAGGYWRNGVLLAPKTGQLIGDLLTGKSLSKADNNLLESFSWDRFTTLGGGKKLAADARYAAHMHPVHRRSKGLGVAASVGTELGFYSGADEAMEERKRDRESSGSEEEDAFEKAARMGLEDGKAFTWGEGGQQRKRGEDDDDGDDDDGTVENDVAYPLSMTGGGPSSSDDKDDDDKEEERTLSPFEGTPDAITVGSSSLSSSSSSPLSSDEATATEQQQEDGTNNNNDNDLSAVYAKIRSNKAKAAANVIMSKGIKSKKRKDPTFRIYRVDSVTRKSTLVPPFTSPEDMEKRLIAKKEDEEDVSTNTPVASVTGNSEQKKAPAIAASAQQDEKPVVYDEKTYDGYQAIQAPASTSSLNEQRNAMKAARANNRVLSGGNAVDESKIGAMRLDDDDDDDDVRSSIVTEKEEEEEEKAERSMTSSSTTHPSSSVEKKSDDDDVVVVNEKTFDGYQAIERGQTREEELAKMRDARIKNRQEE